MDVKDFPMFTTEFGVASLILKEIPYRSEAYIIIQDTQQPEQLLQECISFCRMCGAEKIYARHTLISRVLIALGVSPETAAADACKIEHAISDESFDALKAYIEKTST